MLVFKSFLRAQIYGKMSSSSKYALPDSKNHSDIVIFSINTVVKEERRVKN